MLQEYIPSFKISSEESNLSSEINNSSRERAKLPSENSSISDSTDQNLSFKRFSVFDLRKKVMAGLCKHSEKEGQWRYLVLGEACCHLGLMEDAMVLLQTGKRLSTAAFRRESVCWTDDIISFTNLSLPNESDVLVLNWNAPIYYFAYAIGPMRPQFSLIDKSAAKIPPGNWGLPLIGETLAFLTANNSNKGFYEFVRTRRLRYGSCFQTNIFGKTHVFITGTEFAKAILSNDFVDFTKRYIRSMAELVGHESLLCASREQHKLIRSRLSNLFSTDSISLLIKHFDEMVVENLSNWEQTGTVVVLDEALKITFHAMCKMLISLESLEELMMMQKDVAQICEAMLTIPLKLPWTRFCKGLKARKRIMDKLAELMDQRRRGLKHHDDLLQSLLKEQESPYLDAPKLTDTQIQENILTLIIAGQVTTASAITWMVKYLDENQEVQNTLRDHQLRIAAEACPSTYPTLNYLNEMPDASKVVKESLRMASVVPWFPRVALRDCEIEGFMIKKGWIVNIDARAIHLDPTVYDEPNKFHPWRFSDESKPYRFLAFGTGGRTCLGMNLAKAMMIIFLHRLIITYRWRVIDSDPDLEKRAIFSRLRSGCPVHVMPLAPPK